MNEEAMTTTVIENAPVHTNGGTDKKAKSGATSTLRMFPFGELVCRKAVNARTVIEKKELNELAASIDSVGLLEPIIVYLTKEGPEVGAGFRRYAALKQNGAKKTDEIPCVVRSASSQPIDMLVENVQRQNLPPIDLAEALRKRVEGKYATIDGETPRQWTRKELAEILGLTGGSVENYVRAATNLDDKVKAIVNEHDTPMRVFVKWAALPAERQIEVAKEWEKEHEALVAGGRKRAKRGSKSKGAGEGEGPSRPTKALLEGEMNILQFKLTYVKGAEKEATERQVDTLRYVLGDLQRMPGIGGDDRKAYNKWYKEQAEAEEAGEGDDE